MEKIGLVMCICVINNHHLFGKCLIPLTEYSSLKEELRPSNLSHYWASLAWAAQSSEVVVIFYRALEHSAQERRRPTPFMSDRERGL